MTMTEMMNAYSARSAAHTYALGFAHAGNLYAVKLSFAELSKYFKLDRASSKRGGFAKIRENFERELTERWTSETWVKDSVPFWVAGDMRVDGVEVQVKLDGAELTNERTLARLA